MSKMKHSADKITDNTLHELLSSINSRLGHLEDIEADNRSILIKLIKQNNSIVKFLSKIDIEPIGSIGSEIVKFPPIKEEKPFNLGCSFPL